MDKLEVPVYPDNKVSLGAVRLLSFRKSLKVVNLRMVRGLFDLLHEEGEVRLDEKATLAFKIDTVTLDEEEELTANFS